MKPRNRLPTDAQLPGDAEAPPRYVSFVLRCRTSPTGEILARVSEVGTGLTRAMTDLDDLPAILRDWMADAREPLLE